MESHTFFQQGDHGGLTFLEEITLTHRQYGAFGL